MTRKLIWLGVVALSLLSVPLAAQSWDETTNGGGDAGDAVGTVQVVAGSGTLNEITADIANGTDRDIFRIRIANAAAFSASTETNPMVNSDTQLRLFTTAGVPIAFNDDTSTSWLSALPVGNALYNTLPAGEYLLAVSGYNSRSVSSSGDQFPGAFGTVVGPSNTNPLTGWTGTLTSTGTYRVTLTGCEYAAAPVGVNITTTSLPAGVVGVAYSFTVTGTGGTPANYVWGATGLPAPLAISPSTGQITGTPTGAFSGNVNITLTDGVNNDSDNFNLVISPYAIPQYSTLPTEGTGDGDYINSFTLNTISNLNTGSQGGPTYTDYSGSQTTTLVKGAQYTATIVVGTWAQTITLWIDYNQNNVFDTGTNEEVASGSIPTGAAGGTINFTVASAVSSGATRLRVRSTFGGTPPVHPTNLYTYGECEDYGVTIADPPPSAPVLAAPLSPADGNPILITEVGSDPTPSTDEFLELTNVSAASVDVTGWMITIYDGTTTPVNTYTFSTYNVAAGDTVVISDNAASVSPAADLGLGFNIGDWISSGGGIMLRNAGGQIMDVVFWGSLSPAGVTVPVAVGSHWTGASASQFTFNQSIERSGTADFNVSTDWALGTAGSWTYGTVNTGLTLPFNTTATYLTHGGTDPNFTATAFVGDSLDVTFAATDLNSADTLTITVAVNGASGITGVQAGFTQTFPASNTPGTSPQSLTLTGTAATPGTIILDVSVSDGTLTDSYQLTITIQAVPEIAVYEGTGTGGTLLVTPANITGVNVGSTGTTLTYTIENLASASGNLVLPSNPLSFNVTAGAGTVSVTLGQPLTLNLAPGATTTFTVTIASTASATGAAYTVEVELDNNDSDENPFVIEFDGTATFNNPPRANPGTGTPAFTGTADAGPFSFAADPGASITTSLLVDDVDAHDVQVVLITPSTAQAGITAVASAAGFGASRTVDFTGTLDANAAPGVYTWTIDIEDNQTPAGTRSITVNITLNNVAPVGTNTAILPTTGTGVDLANAYAQSFTQTTTVPATDLFDVTDANLGQTLSIFSQTRTGGTGTTFPFNGQFAITGSAGSFTVSVSTTGALIGTDVGTHEYELVIEDVAAGNQITVFVTLTVTAQTAPTFTPGTSVSIAQGTSQTGVVVGTAADGQDPFSALNVAATNVPTGVTVSAISVNATNGEVTATITVGTGSTAGTALIEFTVTDSLSATGSDDYSFTIVANTLPVITAGSSVTMGTSASLTNRIIADVSDAEDAAGTLTVSVVTAPAGVAISAIVNTAGEVRATITTTAATVGANVVVLQVADSNGATATANFTVNVSTGGGGGGGGGSDGDGGGCAASGGSSSLWLALFGLMAVAAMSLRVRRSRA